MRLVSQSLKYSGDLERLLAGLEGGFTSIMDFMVAEVLSRQPLEITELMVAIAVLDRFAHRSAIRCGVRVPPWRG